MSDRNIWHHGMYLQNFRFCEMALQTAIHNADDVATRAEFEQDQLLRKAAVRANVRCEESNNICVAV
jgi:hypothetical protein